MSVELTAASLDSAVGIDLGASRWIEITQSRVDRFADATEDRQWIHVDPDRARTGPFGTTIAHGFLTVSLLSTALEELLVVSDAAMAINYGMEKVRFPSAVPVGSRVRVHGAIAAVTEVPNGRRVTVRMSVAVDGSAKPACVADFVVIFLTSPG